MCRSSQTSTESVTYAVFLLYLEWFEPAGYCYYNNKFEIVISFVGRKHNVKLVDPILPYTAIRPLFYSPIINVTTSN